MLGPNGALGLAVLELYAGTGSVGFDLLEHGAEIVDFVEFDHRRNAEIKREIQNRGVSEKASTHRADAVKVFTKLTGRRYDLVFADPPYELDPWEELLTGLQSHNLLKPNAWIIAEHATRKPLPDRISGAIAVNRRRYGDSTITVYRFSDLEDNQT